MGPYLDCMVARSALATNSIYTWLIAGACSGAACTNQPFRAVLSHVLRDVPKRSYQRIDLSDIRQNKFQGLSGEFVRWEVCYK